MKNPIASRNGKHKTLSRGAEKRVTELRTIRNNARRAARSGHPGRRADAQRAEATAAVLIRRVYQSEARRG